MSGYVLSVLGIVLVGVMIEIVVPTGEMNKFIKSVFSIFVVAVLVFPVVNLFRNKNNIKLAYTPYETNEKFLNFLNNLKVEQTEKEIKTELKNEEIEVVSLTLNYSTENNEISYISCTVILKIDAKITDKQHIDIYEKTKEIVQKKTFLSEEEIVINE